MSSPLERIPGIGALVASDRGSGKEACRAADCRTGSRVTRDGAECRTHHSQVLRLPSECLG